MVMKGKFMFNSAFFWRVLIAVICVILFYAILPPFLRIIGFPQSGDLMIIVKVVVAALAIFYVFRGPTLTLP